MVLPDDVTWEELRDNLSLIEKIDEAERETERGETIPHDVVMKEVDEWLSKSSGQTPPQKTTKKYSAFVKKDSVAGAERVA